MTTRELPVSCAGLALRQTAPRQLVATAPADAGARVPDPVRGLRNAVGGLITGQEMVRAQSALADRAGARRVSAARGALAESAGGWIGTDSAAAAVTVSSR